MSAVTLALGRRLINCHAELEAQGVKLVLEQIEINFADIAIGCISVLHSFYLILNNSFSSKSLKCGLNPRIIIDSKIDSIPQPQLKQLLTF